MRSIDVTERRARLALRHRLHPEARAASVEDATVAMLCLHATDPATIFLSAWARVQDVTVEDVEKALYVDRALVKHLAMRRTLFVFPAATLPAVQAGASARVAEAEGRRLARDVEQAGLFDDGTQWLEDASEAVLTALADGREATSSQLREEIPLLQGSITYGEGKKWGGEFPVAPRVMTVLSAGGKLVRASNIGGWTTSRPRWATMRSWLGEEPETMDRQSAHAELVRLWLQTFGPGTVADLKWWLGSTVTAVRQALAGVDAVEVDLDGQTGYLLPDDLATVPPVEPWAALLPSLDPTTMGWYERDWYLAPHRDQLFDRTGNAGTTAWWNGRIVGGWRQTASGEVVVDVLEDVDPHARRCLQEEAGRLTDWLAGIRIAARFPSPLSRSYGL